MSRGFELPDGKARAELKRFPLSIEGDEVDATASGDFPFCPAYHVIGCGLKAGFKK